MNEFVMQIGLKKYKVRFTNTSTGMFRPQEYKLKFVPQTKEEFRSDVEFQASVLSEIYFETNDVAISDIHESLSRACEKHIKHYGRLCDSDLFSLVDCSVYIIASMGYNGDSENSLTSIYKTLVNLMIKEFSNDMYEASRFGISKMF